MNQRSKVYQFGLFYIKIGKPDNTWYAVIFQRASKLLHAFSSKNWFKQGEKV